MRAKWSAPIRKYWKISEQMMVKYCDLAICDSVNIEKYIHECYDGKGINGRNPKTTFIAYGADLTLSKLADDDEKLANWYKKKRLTKKGYYLVVGRFVPENSFEVMIREFMKSKSKKDFALITNVNIGIKEKDYELTHLVTMNVGSFGYQGGDFSYRWFQEEAKKARKVSEELDLPLIEINSNLMEIYQENHGFSGTFRMAGAILGLQKLFSKYYISAGFDIKDFDITSEENDDYDLFNLLVGSNESTTFYSTGLEATRFERTKFITQYPVTYDKLTVCMCGNDNCGKCEKCMRTLGALYALNSLDKYRESFDINRFKKHEFMNLARIRYYGIGYMRPLYKEIYSILKMEQPSKYCLYTFVAVFIIYPIEKVKKLIKKILPDSVVTKLKKIGK